MKNKPNSDAATVTCKRCAKCCLSIFAHASGEDMERWRLEGKEEILLTLKRARAVWAGDIIVSQEDGEMLSKCPFLRDEGEFYSCAIYEDRPKVCRNFQPGSSDLCPQFKGTRK